MLRNPSVNIYPIDSEQEPGLDPIKTLIIGVAKGGTAETKKLYSQVRSEEISTLFGATSEVTFALKRYFKYNPNAPDVIPLQEATGSGVSATNLTIEITGTSLEDRTVEFRIFDDEFIFQVGISKGESGGSVVSKLSDLIDDKYPFTAVVNSDKLEVTSKINGIHLNGLISRSNTTVNGLKITHSRSTGGAGLLDTAGIFDQLDKRYHTIISGGGHFQDLIDFLDERQKIENNLLLGQGFLVAMGDKETAISAFNSLNSKSITIFGNFTIDSDKEASKYNMIPLLFLAEFAAIRGLRLTKNANISDFILNTNLTPLGGPDKSVIPYHETPLSYLGSFHNKEFSNADFLEIESAGISILTNRRDGGAALGNVLTLYKYNKKGQLDKQFKYLNSIDAFHVALEYFYYNLKLTFVQSAVDDGVPQVQSVLLNSYNYLKEEWGLIPPTKEADEAFISSLKIEKIVNGVVPITLGIPIKDQFRQFILYIHKIAI